MSVEFENLNPYVNLEYLEAQGADDLKKQLGQIKTPITIINMYGFNGRHFCWFLTQEKITKTRKGNKNGSNSGL